MSREAQLCTQECFFHAGGMIVQPILGNGVHVDEFPLLFCLCKEFLVFFFFGHVIDGHDGGFPCDGEALLIYLEDPSLFLQSVYAIVPGFYSVL